ncbi:endonuclease/exonuclease/phosphatase family protein [Ancylostoma ceylanicum]|uniref:Endonuclease/exonuclease/phosphatase family protein n=1 Tax=Ancylostoma ceylanicum TaxID=53326 RepID=A0A0D6LDE5_9BILA|nr:endonuclease/exonuclease/phosphatase family protein [Ancylostoma ceylanicum]
MDVMASEAARTHPLHNPADPSRSSIITESSSSSETAGAKRRSQSQGRTPWRTERRHTEIDDHTWKYTLDNERTGEAVVGYGNVPIPSKDNIAKLLDRKLSIRAITWNINEKPAKTLDLLANNLEQIPDSLVEDIIIIALQEIPPSTKTFHEDALAIIAKPLRQTHSTLFSYRAWSQMVLVFMKKAHTRFATDATVLQRIQDYHKIMRSLKFPTLCSFKGTDDILHSDCVLWLGDLNFRITEDSKVNWKAQLQQPSLHDIESIMRSDELRIIREKELAFAEFTEAPIVFAPTHKFELGTNDYVPNRIPSYTDRVLYWSRQPKWIETTNYNCIQKTSQSDHRAVYATLRLEVINKSVPMRFNSERCGSAGSRKSVSHE